ncbi:50S ribosomal protein L25/general stress protein Ctc [Bacillus suaedaesalsae]|uniref:Large ribosomal subunit protein bL25 n=1 Tax=Bacillus suaedaesalsae TaxID=2810349 RepID=A0ABS2DCN5_9BACI|nr:50S ribosomal protein L25/general stress protein Ctc [Bacillus suaedaesalsae]MBM6616199.1 50S ribosomal protein L25/general stress protein Ctc [Bacillus suaedaesalsae]
MSQTLLRVEERADSKKSTKKSIRQGGGFPAVVYGRNKDSKNIAVNSGEFTKVIREAGRNGILTLAGTGENVQVMLHELQMDSLKGEVIHADFVVVDMSSDVNVDVNVHLVGEAVGVKDGGVLQQAIHQLPITALPTDIPSAIEVDISNLEVSGTIHVSDIATGGKYKINRDSEDVIASILPPKVEDTVDEGETQSGNVTNEGTEGDEEEK